jgi:hypothetical protein
MTGHGYTAYTRGCRCEVCREAKADYMRARRAAGRALAQKHTSTRRGQPARLVGTYRYVAPVERHGTRAAYEEHGCRCFDCTEARTAADRRYRRAS